MEHLILDSWQIHNRINLYLLDAIEEEHLTDQSASKGRNVGEQFAHLHNVRLMWFKQAHPILMDNLQKIEKQDALKKDHLKANLVASGEAMETLLQKGLADNRIKGFKPHPVGFFSYIIAHESHHRGQIMLSLKQAGHPVSRKIGFGLWEWGTK